MTDIEYSENILRNVEDEGGDHEAGYIGQWPGIRDGLEETGEVREQDVRYIRSGKIFAFDGCLNEEYRDITNGDAWYWHIAEIVEGQYPIGKLPDHVREIARELYY